MAKKSKKRVNAVAEEPREAEVVETREERSSNESSNAPSLARNIAVLVLVLLGFLLLVNFLSNRDDQDNSSATEDETSQVDETEDSDDTDEQPTTENSPNGTTVNETDSAYNFTAGEGESYTTLARRAVASIDSSLSTAERVAAETKLATDANAEWLNSGQSLSFSKDTVRAAVDWAKGLSAEQKAAWQPYADLVAW